MTLAAFLFTLFLLVLAAVGSWTLLGSDTGQGGSRLFERVVEPQRNIPEVPAATAAENAPAREAASEPIPPAAQAEEVVFDMYYEESFRRAEASWSYLSERLQQEVGSPEQWAEQEDIYTLTYMYFTQYPQATISGDTAEVGFEVRLDHTWGSELLSGTWVCVVENGEWKLDRLENETVQPLSELPERSRSVPFSRP
jgi:hypothetical protein